MSVDLTVREVLLRYTEPTVIYAVGDLGVPYLGVNFADAIDDSDGYQFGLARIETNAWHLFSTKRVDLRYALTKGKFGIYRWAVGHGEPGETLATKKFRGEASLFLPKQGVFLDPEQQASVGAPERQYVRTKIDGAWEMDDMREFAALVGDSYVFTRALWLNDASNVALRDLFHKYPWRGGFSTVNFIKDLHQATPHSEDIGISKIQYASPGFVENQVQGDIAAVVVTIVKGVNASADSKGNPIRAAFNEVQNDLKERRWLGSSTDEVVLSGNDIDVLRGHLIHLCRTIGFAGREDHICRLGKDDMLAAVKIMLAYYRRMFWIAEYMKTGKVQHLFSYKGGND